MKLKDDDFLILYFAQICGFNSQTTKFNFLIITMTSLISNIINNLFYLSMIFIFSHTQKKSTLIDSTHYN